MCVSDLAQNWRADFWSLFTDVTPPERSFFANSLCFCAGKIKAIVNGDSDSTQDGTRTRPRSYLELVSFRISAVDSIRTDDWARQLTESADVSNVHLELKLPVELESSQTF